MPNVQTERAASPRSEASRRVQTRCLRWAEDQLRVDRHAPFRDIQMRFWQQVEEEARIPSPAAFEALEYLRAHDWGEKPASLPKEFVKAEEIRLGEAIEIFAEQMMRLPPERRRRKWEKLCAESECTVRARRRCESLEPLLDVEMPTLGTKKRLPLFLMQQIFRKASATPVEGARVRGRVMHHYWRQPAAARRDAVKIQRAYPALASLEPGLIHELKQSKTLAKQDPNRKIETSRAGVLMFIVFVSILGPFFNFIFSDVEKKPEKLEIRSRHHAVEKVTPETRRSLEALFDGKRAGRFEEISSHPDPNEQNSQYMIEELEAVKVPEADFAIPGGSHFLHRNSPPRRNADQETNHAP